MKRKPFLIGLVIGVLMALTINTACQAKTFDDSEHWAKYYIDYVSDEGYMNGTSSTTFSPDGYVTRGMMAQIIANYSKCDISDYNNSSFIDVQSTKYYSNAVCWCYAMEIVNGENSTYFYPDEYITRQDAIVMLNRYLKYDNDANCPFTDLDEVDEYAMDDVIALYNEGIITGSDGEFKPHNPITRAEIATVLARSDSETFDIYDVPPKLSYIGTYKLTYYCKSCNSPSGSLQTASGATATVGRTIALPKSMYSKYKGKTLYIENVGYRVVEDVCGTSVIDIFCSGNCSYQSLSGTYQKVYLVED